MMKMKLFNKKGQINGVIATLLTLGIGIMVLGIAIGFGQDITGDIKDDFATDNLGANCGQNATGGTGGNIGYSSCGLEYNATQNAQEGMAEITSKSPTIAKVGVAVVIIGMIVAGFGVYFMSK